MLMELEYLPPSPPDELVPSPPAPPPPPPPPPRPPEAPSIITLSSMVHKVILDITLSCGPASISSTTTRTTRSTIRGREPVSTIHHHKCVMLNGPVKVDCVPTITTPDVLVEMILQYTTLATTTNCHSNWTCWTGWYCPVLSIHQHHHLHQMFDRHRRLPPPPASTTYFQ